MYIYVNMSSLEQFDPTSSVKFWLREHQRRPKSSDKRKQSEWFYGVFDDSVSGRKRNERPKIQF